MMALVIEELPLLPAPERPDEVDRATLALCRDGDERAFRAFVVRYERPVFALLSRLCGRGPEVEDLAQETFLRAFRAFPRFDLDASARPSTWLLTIATRLALDARRKRRPLADERGDATHDTPERLSSRAELGRAIARAAGELPDEQRAVFVLSELHGLSQAEIARAVGAPESTVKTRLFRAREKLREHLGDFAKETGR